MLSPVITNFYLYFCIATFLPLKLRIPENFLKLYNPHNNTFLTANAPIQHSLQTRTNLIAKKCCCKTNSPWIPSYWYCSPHLEGQIFTFFSMTTLELATVHILSTFVSHNFVKKMISLCANRSLRTNGKKQRTNHIWTWQPQKVPYRITVSFHTSL